MPLLRAPRFESSSSSWTPPSASSTTPIQFTAMKRPRQDRACQRRGRSLAQSSTHTWIVSFGFNNRPPLRCTTSALAGSQVASPPQNLAENGGSMTMRSYLASLCWLVVLLNPVRAWADLGDGSEYVISRAPDYPYQEGWPLPPGYHVESRSRKGLVWSGAAVLGSFYALPLLVASNNSAAP